MNNNDRSYYFQSSSAGESHPHALTEPDVTLSVHRAPIVQPSTKAAPLPKDGGMLNVASDPFTLFLTILYYNFGPILKISSSI